MFILLTQKEIEKFVTLINSGKNTYKDIHNEFPTIKDFYPYYSFIGDEILHVNGEDINFVYFYND